MDEKQKTQALTAGLVLAMFAIIAVVVLLPPPAEALNISLADSTLVGNHSVLILAANGTLLWEGYSTQTADLSGVDDLANQTFVIHLKPENTNVIETPNTLIDEIVRQAQSNMVAIVLLGILSMVLLRRR